MHTLKEYYLLPAEVCMVPTEVFGTGYHHWLSALYMTTGSYKAKLNKNLIVMEIRGVRLIFPNNHGVRLYTLEELNKLPFAGRVWKLKRFTHIPPRVRLVKDRFGYDALVPTHMYSVHGYIGILIGMGMRAERAWKKMSR